MHHRGDTSRRAAARDSDARRNQRLQRSRASGAGLQAMVSYRERPLVTREGRQYVRTHTRIQSLSCVRSRPDEICWRRTGLPLLTSCSHVPIRTIALPYENLNFDVAPITFYQLCFSDASQALWLQSFPSGPPSASPSLSSSLSSSKVHV